MLLNSYKKIRSIVAQKNHKITKIKSSRMFRDRLSTNRTKSNFSTILWLYETGKLTSDSKTISSIYLVSLKLISLIIKQKKKKKNSYNMINRSVISNPLDLLFCHNFVFFSLLHQISVSMLTGVSRGND